MPDTHRISRTVADMQLSAIKEMAILAAQKPDAVSLAWGLPSFRTPEHIRDAVTAALADDPDIGKYALPNGLPELRQAVARHHHEQTGARVGADRQVFITAGNMQGMHSVLRAMIDPGDEIIVTDPGFTSHLTQICLHGGQPVYWPLDEARGWQPNLDALPDLLSPRTRAIIIVNPANPTGTLFSEHDLKALGNFAREHNLLICVDDPYSYFVYEQNVQCFNLASCAEFKDNLAYLFTFSKIHAMSGWRLAYMVVPEWLRGEILKVHDANMICTPRISQVAGMAALTGDDSHITQFRNIQASRRQLICERLDRVPHIFEYVRPDGAYYVFPRIVTPHEDSWEFARRLLDTANVSTTPGIAFGPQGEHHVRLAYCVDEDTINTAFDRIEAAFPA
jgi:aspartate/methionine/tyrosine aminotransferase